MNVEFALPFFIVGIIILWKSSNVLIDHTAKIAVKFGISALIISLTFVAYGTSMPELAVSVGAAVDGHADIALGNIIGSCVANLLLILGISAILCPIDVQKSVIYRELPLMIGATLLLFIFPFFEFFNIQYFFLIGVIFLCFFVVYLFFIIKGAKKEQQHDSYKNKEKIVKNIVFVILGLIGVIIGAWLLIEAAVSIARFFDISEMLIALSMVAVGTSLPELVISTNAMLKKKCDIAIGNVIGSNVFNIVLILGICALFTPIYTMPIIFHLFFLLGISVILIPLLCIGRKITRIHGIIFLLIYFVYIFYSVFG